MFKAHNFTSLPNYFPKLLEVQGLKIVGVFFGDYLVKIGRFFRRKNIAKSLKIATNLGNFSRKINTALGGIAKLKSLEKFVLSEDLHKDYNIVL